MIFTAFLVFVSNPAFITLSASDIRLFTYENPEALIITHPMEKDRVTASPRMSILGACNPDLPLYINGAQTQTTVNGFFTTYAELDYGANTFVFQNGENAQEITITRELSNNGGGYNAPQPAYFGTEIYGSTENNHISRFYDYNDDLYMGTPLAYGTTFKILAETDEFFIIEDGSMLFKSNVYELDYMIQPITVSGGETFSDSKSFGITYRVSDNPLYDIELDDNQAKLTMYARHDETVISQNKQPDEVYITEIAKTATDTTLVHEFTFTEAPAGYTVQFSNGEMKIEFRRAVTSLRNAVVLLDAGHGGQDPGALGPPDEFGPMEKDFNLYVSKIARDYLEALGVTVLFVRDEDVHVPIVERVDYFMLKPDISVCVHANSMPVTSDFTSEIGPLMFYTVDETEKAADELIRVIAAETGNEYQPPKRQNFAMARYTGCPAVLFEMGFLCNPHEYERMLNIIYLDTMGLALGKAIEQYLLGFVDSDAESGEPYENGQNNEPLHETHLQSPPLANSEQPALVQTYENDIDSIALRAAVFVSGVIALGTFLCMPAVFRRKK